MQTSLDRIELHLAEYIRSIATQELTCLKLSLRTMQMDPSNSPERRRNDKPIEQRTPAIVYQAQEMMTSYGYPASNRPQWATIPIQDRQKNFPPVYDSYSGFLKTVQGPKMNDMNQHNFATFFPSGYGIGYPNEPSASRGLPIRVEGGDAFPNLMPTNPMTCTLKTFHCPNCLATIPPEQILVNIETTSCGNGHKSENIDMKKRSEWPSFPIPSGSPHQDSVCGSFMILDEMEAFGPCSVSPGDFSSWPVSDDIQQATAISSPNVEGVSPVTSVTAPQRKASVLPMSDTDGADLDDRPSAETTPSEDHGDNSRKRAQSRHKGTGHKRRKSTNYKVIFACSLGECDQTFTLQKDLDRHQRQSLVHKTEWENKFFCEESRCSSFGKSYTRKDNFNRHVETKHGKFVA